MNAEDLEQVVIDKTRRRFQGHDFWPQWVAELFPHRKLYVPGYTMPEPGAKS